MTRQRLAIASGVAAAAVALVLVLALTGGSHPVELPQQAVSGQTQLSRSGTLFADPLRASVHVLVDRHRVDPARIGFTTSFEPYVHVGPAHVARHDTGPVTELTYSAELICLFVLALAAFMRIRRGVGFELRLFLLGLPILGLASMPASWLLLEHWRWALVPQIQPMRTLLFVAAGLLFAVGLLALLRFVQIGKLRFRLLSPLERAVVLVERSHDDSPEKRKALELLSRELARSGEPELALLARELAWAEPAPLPTATQPLTLDVRRAIEQRSNGQAA